MVNTRFKDLLSLQTGRTMTEILGVLAIVGIMTIGGIAGYRYSLDRIMANEVVNGVRMRSVIIGQQRVLEQDLDLKEFHPDSAEDKIYGQFKVEAFNDYPNDRPSPYGSAVVSSSGLNGEENVQALEVYDIPYRVCEILKKTDFPDPTYTAINGELYSWNYGERKYDVECIPDGDVIREGGMISSALDGEYHNVLSFVFHDSVGALCSYDSECHPLCCDNETGVCVRDYGKCHCDVCEERQANGSCKPKDKGVKVVSGADPSQDRCCDGKGGIGLCPPKKCEYNGKIYESGSKIEDCGRCTNGNVLMGDWTDEECITCSATTGYKIVNKGQKGCDGVCGSNKTDDGCGCGVAKTAEGCCPGQVKDCAGVCGGSATKDCAGVCNGTAKDDGCGCGIAKTAEGCCPGQVKDCAGVCGGTATKDCAGVCGGTATNRSVTYKYLDGNCCKSKTETKCLAAGESGPASTCSADKITTSETNNTCSTVTTTTNLCTNVKTTSTTNKPFGTSAGECKQCDGNGNPVDVAGCCASGTTKLFNERKQNNKTQTFAGCCADGKLLKGDESTATKFRKKWKEGATGTTDSWSCCGDNQTIIGTASNTSSSCCLTSRVYKVGSTDTCCAKDLSQASDNTKVCCTGNKVNVGGGLCCASGQINASGHCCNSGQGWADNMCCASNRIYTAGNTKKCCESPNEFINGICQGPATLTTCHATGKSHDDWSTAVCQTTNNTNSNYRIRISGTAVYGHTGYRLNGQIISGQCESSSLGGTKVELAHRSHKKSAKTLSLSNKDAGVLEPGGTFCYYMYTNYGGPRYDLTVTFTRED